MRYIFIVLLSILSITGMAQKDSKGNSTEIPERTPELKALYQDTKHLENTGTATELNANRLAIKSAWEEVDPEIAALYKPLAPVGVHLGISENEITPEQQELESRLSEYVYWNEDFLLHDDFIDGVDLDVTGDGDIYIAAFENDSGQSGGTDSFFVYRSVNNGNSFQLWKSLDISGEIYKIQIISMDGDGDEYLLVFINASTSFSLIRINMANGGFTENPINSGVLDFSVDRSYPDATANQRVFATYLKDDGSCPSGGASIFSARTMAGSYGFDWVDETSLGECAIQTAFAYGKDGGCYTTFIEADSGDLYASANPDSNDPGSWETNENLRSGTSNEMRGSTIRAARKSPTVDHVIIGVSTKQSSGNRFNNLTLLRENGALYTNVITAVPADESNYLHVDSWVRQEDDVDQIRTSFVHTFNTENDIARSRTYNGDGTFETSGRVSDSDTDVWGGFAPIIAETHDGLPCLAFAGTSTDGTRGYGLYFDARTDLMSTENNLIDGFTFYPNPAQNSLHLSAKNTINNVTIYSLLGQQVMELSPEQKNHSIDVSSLARGVYVMKVKVDSQEGSYKIIKK